MPSPTDSSQGVSATRPRPAGDYTAAVPGIILLDDFLRPVFRNAVAVQVLVYPHGNGKLPALRPCLPDEFWAQLANGGQPEDVEIHSGKRRYTLRAIRLLAHNGNGGNGGGNGTEHNGGRFAPRTAVILLLERRPHWSANLASLASTCKLTPREQEAVGWLARGLTSEEIAAQMGVSTNTVKAFLRMAMIKVGANTRAGILGSLLNLTSPLNGLAPPNPVG